MNNVFQEFESATRLKIEKKLAANLTTMAVGGNLQIIEIQHEEELHRVWQACNLLGLNYRILGAGSNLLIPDTGVSDLVIKLGRNFKGFTALSNNCFRVGAASSLMSLSRDLCKAGFAGLEFAGGIPASVGGAVFMNAGAHTGEISDVIKSIKIFHEGKIIELSKNDLNFSYRNSQLPDRAIILQATLELLPGDANQIFAKRNQNLQYRKMTQPLSLPSFGSVFKNPQKDLSAGALIESLGLKGFQSGGAEISKLHANWIVNPLKTATCEDVLKIINYCIEKARGFSIDLKPEVQIW